MADTSDDAGDLRGIDPYIFWILGAGRRYFFLPGRHKEKEEWLPLLLRLRETDAVGNRITADSFANGLHIRAREKRSAWMSAVRVPSLYTESEIGAGEGPYITALVQADYLLDDFARDDELREDIRSAVESVTPSLPLDSTSLPSSESPAAPGPQEPADPVAEAPVPEGTVIMGVIDDGIAFVHERFRKIVGGAVESRVAHWWLQDGPFSPPQPPYGPQDVPYGCEMKRAEINTLLQQCTTAGIVDEDLVYQRAVLNDFRQDRHKSAAWRVAHGTHVMDLACGADPSPPCYDRPIICVQLPISVTADTSGGHLFRYVVDAIWYILDRASTIPGAALSPVVINLSYGRLEGPHDGTSDIELAIEIIVALIWRFRRVRLRVILPAGNSYLLRTHSEIRFTRIGEVVTLPWRILPDDQTPSFSEIWLPARASGSSSSRIEATIIAPAGESHTIDESGGSVQWTGGGGPVYAEARYYVSPLTNRGMFRISLAATTDLDTTAPLAPAGVWQIYLRNILLTQSEAVHAWVQRDDSLYGFPLRGRQSYFDDPGYVRFDQSGRDKETDDSGALAQRDSTLNSIATGDSPIVMGGYLRKEGVPAKYSSAGAETPPPRWPDAMASSDDSRVHQGILAAGSRSGSVVPLNGTSVAAPQIARIVADNLAAGGNGDRPMVWNRAQLDDPGYVPNKRGGYGRIKTDPIVKLKRYE